MSATETARPIELFEQDGWAELRINRPEKRNALTGAMVDEILRSLDRLAEAGRAVVLLSAVGSIFCAGADLNDRGSGAGKRPVERLLEGLLSKPVVIIAEVAAPALGAGLAILSCCTAVVCAEDCWFALPEGRLGFFPEPMVFYIEDQLPARVLMNLALGQAKLSATEAAASGLVSMVVPHAELRTRSLMLVARAVAEPDVFQGARAYWQGRFHRRRAQTATLQGKDEV